MIGEIDGYDVKRIADYLVGISNSLEEIVKSFKRVSDANEKSHELYQQVASNQLNSTPDKDGVAEAFRKCPECGKTDIDSVPDNIGDHICKCNSCEHCWTESMKGDKRK
jgi:hypothetical protein